MASISTTVLPLRIACEYVPIACGSGMYRLLGHRPPVWSRMNNCAIMKPARPDFNRRHSVGPRPHPRVNSDPIANFERLLASGKEGPLLRFSLGAEYLKIADAPNAAAHLRRAVELDPDFSAAWKLLGRALTECGRFDDALAVYDQGIAVAERKGDIQAAKEMALFARRIRKQRGPP